MPNMGMYGEQTSREASPTTRVDVLTRAEWDAQREVLRRALVCAPEGCAPSEYKLNQAVIALFGPRPADPFPRWEDPAVYLGVFPGRRGSAPIRVRFRSDAERGVTAHQARDLAAALNRAADWDDARNEDGEAT